MKFILARKERMTQIFDEKGIVHPGTVLSVGSSTVTQVKTKDGKDGYNAVQLGYGEKRAKLVNKAQTGKPFRVLKEFRVAEGSELAPGATVGIETFAVGDSVRVSGTTKGKGFQGVVKRHGFHGGRRTHGQKHSEREAGSIGGGPGRAGGRVVKGMRMAGRMGGDRVTVKNLTVLHVDPQAGEIIISGAIPGSRGSLVEIVGA